MLQFGKTGSIRDSANESKKKSRKGYLGVGRMKETRKIIKLQNRNKALMKMSRLFLFICSALPLKWPLCADNIF